MIIAITCIISFMAVLVPVDAVGRAPGPTAAPECALIPDPGNCQGFFRRFYYDRWTGVRINIYIHHIRRCI